MRRPESLLQSLCLKGNQSTFFGYTVISESDVTLTADQVSPFEKGPLFFPQHQYLQKQYLADFQSLLLKTLS